MTFRVEEEEGEEEVLEVPEEEPINPSIGVGVNPHIMRNTETGMPARQQAPAQAQGGPMKMSHGMNTRNGRRIRIETLLDISPGTLRTGRGQEVPAQEERGIAEEIEARIGMGAGENTKRVEGTIGETIARAPVEGTTAQRGRAGGTIAQDIDRSPGVEETTHLKRAEGTLAKTDEEDAKGPLVMEGP